MIPKFNETMLPILILLSDKKEFHSSEIIERLYTVFGVSDFEKGLKSPNGTGLFANKVGWGKSYLKQAGLISYPKRGYAVITGEGVKVASSGISSITVNDLKKYESFLKFITPLKKELDDGQQIISDDLTPEDLIEQGFKKFDNALRKDLLDKLMDTNPYFFEKIILILFKEMGYGDFIETPKSGDDGIDGIINQDALGLERIYTQAKRYTQGNVGGLEIRNFIGSMNEVSKGIFVTTSDFSQSAIDKVRDAKHHKIILINGEKLVDLMIRYNVGVQKKKVYEIKEVDGDFFIED